MTEETGVRLLQPGVGFSLCKESEKGSKTLLLEAMASPGRREETDTALQVGPG